MNFDTTRLSRGHWLAGLAALWLIVGVFQPFYSFDVGRAIAEVSGGQVQGAGSISLSGWDLLFASGDRTNWNLKISTIVVFIAGLAVLGLVLARAADIDLVSAPAAKVRSFGSVAIVALATRIFIKPGGDILPASLAFGLIICFAGAAGIIGASTMMEDPDRHEAPAPVAEALAVR